MLTRVIRNLSDSRLECVFKIDISRLLRLVILCHEYSRSNTSKTFDFKEIQNDALDSAEKLVSGTERRRFKRAAIANGFSNEINRANSLNSGVDAKEFSWRS